MEPMGRHRRGKAWRCPTCRVVFLDVEAMRRDRKGQQPPKWAPVVPSVLFSLLATVVVRRLRRHSRKPTRS
jgi:hypothetical protein